MSRIYKNHLQDAAPPPPDAKPPDVAAPRKPAPDLQQENKALKRELDKLNRESLRADDKMNSVTAELQATREALREMTRQLASEKRRQERLTKRLSAHAERQAARAQRLESLEKARQAETTGHERDVSSETVRLRQRVRALEEEASQATRLLEKAAQELARHQKAAPDARATREQAEDATRRREQAERQAEIAQREVASFRRDLIQLREQHTADRTALVHQVETLSLELRQTAQRLELAALTEQKLLGDVEHLRTANRMLEAAHAEHRRRPPPAAPPPPPPPLPDMWRLRLGDGSVFGPVTEVELHAWTCDCRIGPDHEVSRDGQTWIKAREITALHMDWLVVLADGASEGPLNLFAVQHLLADGSLGPDASLRHV